MRYPAQPPARTQPAFLRLNTMTTDKQITLIRRKTLLGRIPFTDRHILNLEKQGKFPKRRVLGPRSVAWVEAEVNEWIASRAQGPAPVPCAAPG